MWGGRGPELRRRGALLLISSALVLGALGVACGRAESVDCGPEDQRGSFLPSLPAGTARLAIDPAFDPISRESILQVVETWNQLGSTIVGRSFFAAQASGGIPRSMPVGPQDCDGVAGSSEQFSVQLDSSDASQPGSRWVSLGLNSSNPAVTIRCYEGSNLQKQVVLINARYVLPAQFRSVVLHELGHAVGLDHSCQMGEGSGDWVGCQGLGNEHPYVSAVMFPYLRMGNGSGLGAVEIKENLQFNDQIRVGCRYQNR